MKKLLIPIASLLILAACSKVGTNANSSGNVPLGKIAPDGFTFQTTKNITVEVAVQTNINAPIAHVPVSVYAYTNNVKGNKIGTAITDASGNVNFKLSVPADMDTFIVTPNLIGVMNNAKVYLSGNILSCTLGGSTGFKGNVAGTFQAVVAESKGEMSSGRRGGASIMGINGITTNTVYVFDTADVLGVPTNLVFPNDTINPDLIKTITSILPEQKSLMKSVQGSSYLNSNATSDIVLTQQSDVYTTFVYEGAGYHNSLGYYTYPTNNPPVSVADIKKITLIFPNCKYVGDGGGLVAGNKVKLGNFPAGTTIGFVLYAAGWNSYASVNTNVRAYFSDSYLNPETVDTLQKHSILINYLDPATNRNLYLTGFEDYNRQSSGCDNDFNDVMFYTTSTPASAINNTGIKPVESAVDSDGDGVCDALDAYPNDPTRAYDTYYPGLNQYGTIAFEDNWPYQGDYDMNDLVVSYQYHLVSNAQNQVVELYGNFAPIAAGANYQNGFGVQLPFASTAVASVTGQRLGNGYITLNSNGTEAGQTNAVIIPFDATRQLISNPDGNPFVNTQMSETKVTGDTAHIYIKLTTPLGGIDPSLFNPFCISNMRRGYEIHLPGFSPTSLANLALLGTGNDASNPSTGIYYVTKNNYPFAINFLQPFSYPTEATPINNAYLHFFDWSGGGGATYKDWYYNTATGYRNTSNVYSK